MSICSHQTHPLKWLSIQRYVGRPTITFTGILEYISVRHTNLLTGSIYISVFGVLIDSTAVGTIETGITAYVANTPI